MNLNIFAYLIVFAGIVNLLRMTLFLVGSDIYSLRAERKLKKQNKRTAQLPTFSVVIPARNEEGTVLRAIKSILNNNYPALLEIVVVDDGSTDNTTKAVQTFIAQNPSAPLTVIKQQNAGKAHALNNGIKNFTQGELVMCLDADSYIVSDSLMKAAHHFSDPKVMALSSNVKIINRKGLLNLVQRFEYLLCYQMKRAESLLNCEYIVGGIGSIFRRSVLEKINYYDTDTVTEDIDITMKVLELGNKDNKVVYGADVVAYTESVLSITDLIKQRYRWKWGRAQTFFKNKHMFLSRESRFTKSLSWFYLPFALFGDLMYLIEPILLSYIVAMSLYYHDPSAIISAWVVISTYLMLNVLAEDTFSVKTKATLILLAPFMYILFYLLSFVEYVALLKSVVNLHKLEKSLTNTKNHWVRVSRPTENAAKLAVGGPKLQTFAYALAVIAGISLLTSVFTYEQPKEMSVQKMSSANPVRTVSLVNKPESAPTVIPAHIVKPNENLWSIASDYYGDGSNWKKLIVKKKTDTLRPGDVVEFPQE